MNKKAHFPHNLFIVSFYTKLAVITIIFFSVRLFFSCTPPDPIDISYNTAVLISIDNSGQYTNYGYPDTLYSDAIALQLILSDSTHLYYASNVGRSINTFGFETACATSINYSFRPVNQVRDIQFYTLLDMNDTFKAGDNISDSILYSYENMFELYSYKDEAIKHFNKLQNDPFSKLNIVLKASVKNKNAQFRVEVSLDDGSLISDTTDVLTIIP